MTDVPAKLRIDKWLWHARFFKTRGLAAKQVGGGHVRINGDRVAKPSSTVVPGDVLTFAQADRIRVVRVAALGERRGPAAEAQTLYADMTPPPEPQMPPGNPGFSGGGRPSGRDRRMLDRFRQGGMD